MGWVVAGVLAEWGKEHGRYWGRECVKAKKGSVSLEVSLSISYFPSYHLDLTSNLIWRPSDVHHFILGSHRILKYHLDVPSWVQLGLCQQTLAHIWVDPLWQWNLIPTLTREEMFLYIEETSGTVPPCKMKCSLQWYSCIGWERVDRIGLFVYF